jgi:hypothetical protein
MLLARLLRCYYTGWNPQVSGSNPQMVGLGVDFRPGQPSCHSSPQAASQILLKIVVFLGSPSANLFAWCSMIKTVWSSLPKNGAHGEVRTRVSLSLAGDTPYANHGDIGGMESFAWKY